VSSVLQKKRPSKGPELIVSLEIGPSRRGPRSLHAALDRFESRCSHPPGFFFVEHREPQEVLRQP
jgi:hypothetical protein